MNIREFLEAQVYKNSEKVYLLQNTHPDIVEKLRRDRIKRKVVLIGRERNENL